MMHSSNLFNAFFTEIKSLRNYLILIISVIVFSYSLYFFLATEKIIQLGEENSFFELGTALCFFLSSFLFVFLFVKRKNIFFLLLGLLLFFGAGEEMSWGQHLFRFNTPEKIKANNVQGEFNIHNIEIFNTDKFNNCRKSGIERLLEMNFLFRVFCIFYGILIPLICSISSPLKNQVEKINIPIPPLPIGIFFIINWIFYKLTLRTVSKNLPLPYYETSTEIYEFITSVIWMLIAFYFFQKLWKARAIIKVS